MWLCPPNRFYLTVGQEAQELAAVSASVKRAQEHPNGNHDPCLLWLMSSGSLAIDTQPAPPILDDGLTISTTSVPGLSALYNNMCGFGTGEGINESVDGHSTADGVTGYASDGDDMVVCSADDDDCESGDQELDGDGNTSGGAKSLGNSRIHRIHQDLLETQQSSPRADESDDEIARHIRVGEILNDTSPFTSGRIRDEMNSVEDNLKCISYNLSRAYHEGAVPPKELLTTLQQLESATAKLAEDSEKAVIDKNPQVLNHSLYKFNRGSRSNAMSNTVQNRKRSRPKDGEEDEGSGCD